MTFLNLVFRQKQSLINQLIIVGLGIMTIALYGIAWTESPLKFSKQSDCEKSVVTLSSVREMPYEDIHLSFETMISNKLQYPRFSPVEFSTQLVQIKDIHSRKKTFVNNLLPAILASNETIKADRRYILMLKKTKDSGQPLSLRQQGWLKQLASRYKLQRVTITELLKRVDVIPPSLALGQAVVETGWGGSVAAQRLRSPFGMMRSRDQGFSYNNLQESVLHYIHNLNTHDAYTKMRTIRANLRHAGDDLCSLQLAEGLVHYSELGKTYVSRVKNIIHSFNLRHYDQAFLAKQPNFQLS